MPRRALAPILAAAVLAAGLAGACSDDNTSASGFCNALRNGPDPVALFAGYQPGGDRTALVDGIKRLRDLEAAAPSEVADSMHTLVQTATSLTEAVAPASTGGVDTTTTTLALDATKIEAASKEVRDYAQAKCGLTLG